MSGNKDSEELEFQGRIIRNIFSSEGYQAYAIEVDKEKYPFIKYSKYGNAVISGDLHTLGDGIVYNVKAVEKLTKNGTGYEVINIKRERPNSSYDMYLFLQEILTPTQATTLYEAYPDIVERVMSNNLEDIDLSKTKGIKEYTFGLIKEKIIENFALAELVTEFKGLLSLTMVKKLYSKYTSIEKIRIEMKKNPYKCLCGISGVGFKTADSILLDIEKQSNENICKGLEPIVDFECDLKTSMQRCLACLLYLLEENEGEGHSRMDLIKLKKECDKLVPACAHHFIEAVKDQNIYYNKEKKHVAMKRTYLTEAYIALNIFSGVSVESNVWNIEVEKYRTSGNFPLTDEQLGSLSNACKYNVSMLIGNAGSGKTACTQSMIKMFDEHNKHYLLLSPTGKAAKVLSEYCERTASTIHRGLGYLPPEQWMFNVENKLMYDVVIIDEFSMTDIFLFKRVIDAIDFNITKLVIIGDSAQIPSVACGNLLHDFIQSDIIPKTVLTQIFRYGEGGLMTVATDVRNCKRFLPEKIEQCTYFGDNKDYAFVRVDDSAITKNVLALYKKLLSQNYHVEDIQVLSSYNKGEYGTVVLNNHLQKIANKNYGSDVNITCGDTTYYVGDLVIQKQNNYKAKVYIASDYFMEEDESAGLGQTFIANGETGVILEINRNGVVIDFDGVKVIYDKGSLQTIGLGYSISIHKSQGSSAKIVILLTPKSHTYTLNSNLIYVGLTRMKERCFHLGTPETVNTAIKKKENFNRMTFMCELLEEIKNNKNSKK